MGALVGVGHELVEAEGLAVDLVLELVARPACPSTQGTATLNHEVANDPMEDDTVVEPISGQGHEVVHRDRRPGGVEVDFDRVVIGVDGRRVLLVEVERELGRSGV